MRCLGFLKCPTIFITAFVSDPSLLDIRLCNFALLIMDAYMSGVTALISFACIGVSHERFVAGEAYCEDD
jgi:hypothetical protein